MFLICCTCAFVTTAFPVSSSISLTPLSSNLKNSKYDVETNELVVEFKKGGKYSYENVPLSIFTKMRIAESQGSYFAKNISKTYKYKKLS